MTPAASAVIAAAVAELRDAGVPTETRVATLRGAFGRAKLRAVGQVWRVGALCLADDGALFATRDVLMVTEPTHPNHRSALAVERNELRRLLRRAGLPVGATVVLDAHPLDLDHPELPLVSTPDGIGVQWAAGGEPVRIEHYLTERVALLTQANAAGSS